MPGGPWLSRQPCLDRAVLGPGTEGFEHRDGAGAVGLGPFHAREATGDRQLRGSAAEPAGRGWPLLERRARELRAGRQRHVIYPTDVPVDGVEHGALGGSRRPAAREPTGGGVRSAARRWRSVRGVRLDRRIEGRLGPTRCAGPGVRQVGFGRLDRTGCVLPAGRSDEAGPERAVIGGGEQPGKGLGSQHRSITGARECPGPRRPPRCGTCRNSPALGL
jgi:hypothetical protein